jgi:sulfur-oxidizing protein SoxY
MSRDLAATNVISPARRDALARLGTAAGVLAASPLALAQLKSGDDPHGSPRWQMVRNGLFAGREIADDGDAVARLEVPGRAEDAALMPLAIRAQFEQTPQRHIRKVWLVIDNNPSPLSSVFTFTLDSGRADIETRVRVDEYTFMRAISETNDGRLHASTRFVKAAGGCSAPPGKDAAAAQASLGQMRLRVVGSTPAPDKPVQAQLMISHPNDSGFVMDQLTRQYTPPHFVRRVDVSYGGKLVLSADLDFSISENPNLRFFFVARDSGELTVQVVDSKELQFKQTLALRPTQG